MAAALALAACGGGGSPDAVTAEAPATPAVPPAGAPGDAPPAADPGATTDPAPGATPVPGADPLDTPVSAAAAHVCSVLPPLPVKPTGARSVRDFGARGDDSTDDTAAIQAAINALQPGQWLVFPAGRYIHSKSIRVNKANVVLWSEGATLHATNPADQAVWLEADGASVYNFTLTAVTGKRLTAPWESRIAVFGGANPRRLLKNNVIRNNRVINGGAPGTELANASSSAGIFVYNATGFLVAQNTVQRSLADAIHITAGSYNGRVLRNTVREPGDDLIAMVSYIGAATLSASQVNAEFDARKARDLVHDVLVAGNDVAGNYWGRGITVVGGQNVTIENNKIARTNHSAGLYFARELSYLTFGVRNVLVRNNALSDSQTLAPSYAPVGFNFRTTGHGGIEIYSHMFADEKAYPKLADGLAVELLRFENNSIDRVKADGVRIGNGTGGSWSYNNRAATGGRVGSITFLQTRLSGVPGKPLNLLSRPTADSNVLCEGTTVGGVGYVNPLCSAPRHAVTGANVTCG